MKLPLLQINQKKEYIYASKMKVKELRNFVKLNFRYPYLESSGDNKDKRQLDNYINKLLKKGLTVEYNEKSVQRKMQIEKLNEISKYIEETNNIIPNAIILACYNKKIENKEVDNDYGDYITQIDDTLDLFSIDLNDDYEMVAIDGQHRLGGYFISKSQDVQEMDVPIIILFGPSLSVCSKMFIDINGNQKQVGKSLIYDLTAVLEEEFDSNKLKDREIKTIRSCHKLIKTLYSDSKSPLYKQIRMMGTGEGSISQAFLVEMIYPLLYKGVLSNYTIQDQLNALYIYLRAIQSTFPDDWPLLEGQNGVSEQEKHSFYVLNDKKSQLPKTLGMGAFMSIFPDLFKKYKFSYEQYENCFCKLKNRVIWSKEEYNDYLTMLDESDGTSHSVFYERPIFIEGTNKVAIKKLAEELLNVLFRNR